MPNGYNTIIETIKTHNLKSFQSLVHEKSPHLNKIQQFFQLSCQFNSIEILHYIFQLNPKIYIRYKNDLAFKLACKNGNLQIIKILYEKNHNINVQNVLLDFLPKINPFSFNGEITKFLFSKIEENISVNSLKVLLHKICNKIIILDYAIVNEYLINKIINKYIHLLDIFELSKNTIEYNQLYLLDKFIIYLDDKKIVNLLKISLENISIEKYNLIEYLIYKVNNDVADDLFEYIKNSCKTGDQKLVEIVLSRFDYESIIWPYLSYIAMYYNHISIVDTIFSYYPELIKDVKERYEMYDFYKELYNYLNSKISMSEFTTIISTCDEKCPICLEQHDTFIKTKCGHLFGENCIKEWICYGNFKCPYCRSHLL